MTYTSDRDGKSKTASAVDRDSYPEQHEVHNRDIELETHEAHDGHPTHETQLSHDKIAHRAFELWQTRDGKHGSSEQDWLQAEAELRSFGGHRHRPSNPSGSVQP